MSKSAKKSRRRCDFCDRRLRPQSAVVCRRRDCLEVFAYRLVKMMKPFLRGVAMGLGVSTK